MCTGLAAVISFDVVDNSARSGCQSARELASLRVSVSPARKNFLISKQGLDCAGLSRSSSAQLISFDKIATV